MIRMNCKKKRREFERARLASEASRSENERRAMIASLGKSSRLLLQLARTIVSSYKD